MELRPTLASQLKHAITITPQVIQSIKLLKYGHDDLYAFLREQEERNPLIQVVGGTPEPSVPTGTASATATHRGPGEDTRARGRDSGPIGQPHGGGAAGGSGRAGQSANGQARTIEETCASAVSLREYLLCQIRMTFRDHVNRIIAIEIAESVEPDGYLRRKLDEIADSLGVEPPKVDAVLERVQALEPAGVAARNLSECLRLQLRESGRLTPAMSRLLEHLELLANYDLDRLAHICGVDRTTLAEMVHAIKELDPRPGFQFDTEPVMPALPDLKLEMSDDGSFRVELNSELLPKVLVDREYYAEMKAGTTGGGDTRFVVDCMKNATWLARNLDQRANTILKVATAIVSHQRDFFLHGVEHIKPLSQGDIAEAVGMHASTICRATADKYIMTSRGMFELKFFFSNSLAASDGGAEHSAESIRARIHQLVQGETPDAILSDDAIMSLLNRDGVAIARRTVAKYREMMNIPASQIRKRKKRAAESERKLCVA